MGRLVEGIACAVWLLVACGGDDGGGGDGAEPDGSIGDGGGGSVADAGDPDSGAAPDASPPDASLDASLDAAPDAAPGPVTVTFSLPGLESAGVVVFFLRSDSSVVDVVVTGEDGRAQATLDEPGVVVILSSIATIGGPRPNAFAYLDVPPGSDIFHGAQPIPDLDVTLTVNGPAATEAVAYRARTVCGLGSAMAPSVPVSMTLCPPQTHVLWTQFFQSGPSLTAFTPTVDVEAGAVTVGGELRPDLLQTSRFTGLPETSTADMNYDVMGPHGPVQFGQQHISEVPVNGELAIVDQLHDLRGLGLVGQQRIIFFTPLGEIQLRAWVDHDGAPVVDVADSLPPLVLTSSFARATGTVRWTEDEAGSASMAHASVTVGEPTASHFWNVIGPADALALPLPRLPPPYDELNIEPTSVVPGVGLTLYRRTGGYAGFLADFHGATGGTVGTPGQRMSLSFGNPVVE